MGYHFSNGNQLIDEFINIYVCVNECLHIDT
jgi:hypothetical protein